MCARMVIIKGDAGEGKARRTEISSVYADAELDRRKDEATDGCRRRGINTSLAGRVGR